ncbi:hypothetical protein C8J56DRAFT_964299 [Mycena floridula]|nr:hypothetical protein C8J56DRAFT_964299 [Mycena floridula]
MTKEASTMAIDSGKYIRQDHTVTFGLLILLFQLALTSWLMALFATHLDAIPSTETNRVRFVLCFSVSTLLHSLIHGLLFWYNKGAPVGIAGQFAFIAQTWILWTGAAATITKMLIGGLNCKTQKQFTYCTQMNAVVAFAWIEWLLITFALIVVLFRGFAIPRRGDGWDGWSRRALLLNEEQAIKLDEEKGRVTLE